MSGLRCSVVIPSYNRAKLLERLLQALSAQTLPPEQFEVIVALDGATDDSAAILQRWQRTPAAPALQWFCQSRAGQAAARTAGAQRAQAPILVFLDDDVIPAADLLATHLRWHAADEALAVLGSAPVQLPPSPSLYDLVVWSWWEDTYHQRALPGRQSSYRDFCAGNVSLRREDFLRAGGFDPAFRGYGGEDYDLGYRLLQQGVRFVIDVTARAAHYHTTSPGQVLAHMRQEGRHDVLLATKHPALRRGLRLMQRRQRAEWIFRHPHLCAIAMRVGMVLLPHYERGGWKGSWRRLFGKLRHTAYWAGVREALGTWPALQTFWAAAPALPEQTLDITEGLPAQLPALWVEGPSRVRITAHGQCLGVLALPEPIDSPLHPYLAEQLLRQLKPQLAQLILGR